MFNDGEDAAAMIRQFRALVTISEVGSFAAAARALNLTQSAISMQVAALEQQLGVTLFDRAHRPPRLTAEGTRVLARARAIVAEYDAMLDAVTQAAGQRGTIRLGAIPTVLTSLLPRGLAALREQEPRLAVHVTSALSGELMAKVEAGELDAALMHRPDRVPPGLGWQAVARQRIMLIAPPDSTEETPAEIFARLPWIRIHRSAWVASLIEERMRAFGLNPPVSGEFLSLEAIHTMVSLGFGASVLPDVSGMAPAMPPLRILDFGDPPLSRTVGMLSRRDAGRLGGVRVLAAAFARIGMETAGPADAA